MADNQTIKIDLFESTEGSADMDLSAICKVHNDNKSVWSKDDQNIKDHKDALPALYTTSYSSLETFSRSQSDLIRLLLGEIGKVRHHLEQTRQADLQKADSEEKSTE
jgi:hypothetical protein